MDPENLDSSICAAVATQRTLGVRNCKVAPPPEPGPPIGTKLVECRREAPASCTLFS